MGHIVNIILAILFFGIAALWVAVVSAVAEYIIPAVIIGILLIIAIVNGTQLLLKSKGDKNE